MSLDVYLELPADQKLTTLASPTGSGIWVRRNGRSEEISRAEWDRFMPGTEPAIVAPDHDGDSVYSANITHNLGKMADAAGIYKHLWRPEELGITIAGELVEPLAAGLARLKSFPDHYRAFNAPNGWGLYEQFVPFVEEYLAACREYPEATVRVSR